VPAVVAVSSSWAHIADVFLEGGEQVTMGVCGTYLCFLFFLSACFFPFFVVSSPFPPVLVFFACVAPASTDDMARFRAARVVVEAVDGGGDPLCRRPLRVVEVEEWVWGIQRWCQWGAMGWWWAVGKIVDICCGCARLALNPMRNVM